MSVTNRKPKAKSRKLKLSNGAGSVIQRSDGRWMARYTTRDPETGEAVRKTLYGHGPQPEQDARSQLISALEAKQKGTLTFQRGRIPTLADYAESWLASGRGSRVRPTTALRYRQLLATATESLGGVRLTDLEPRHVDGLLTRLHKQGLSARSCNHVRAVLRALLASALKNGTVSRNVAALADPLPVTDNRESLVFTPQEAKRFAELAQSHDDGALWMMALTTGARQSELLGLTWDNVDLESCHFTIRRTLQHVSGRWVELAPKTRRSARTIPLSRMACEALRHQKAAMAQQRLHAGEKWTPVFGDLCFAGAYGLPLDGTAITKRLAKALQAAGLPPLRFHDLRHSASSLLAAMGISGRDRMAVLGHSQISTTENVYTSVYDDSLRAAADAMDRLLTTPS
jgi:integrase